jgi:hypothetical protein
MAQMQQLLRQSSPMCLHFINVIEPAIIQCSARVFLASDDKMTSYDLIRQRMPR